MINTIKKSWKDVTIDEYFDLCKRLSDDTLTDYEKIIIKIAFITGKNEDEIWNLTWTEFRELQVEALWMDEFQLKENVKFKSIEINGEKYSIDTNLQNFTVAQYIDFQTFFPKRKENQRIIGNILACFIIPQGKKYAEDYDIKELVDNINSNLDIMTANEILFFFSKAISDFNKGYSQLLQLGSKEDEEEIKEQGGSGEVGNGVGESEESYFDWLALVDNVGQLTRDKWDDVFKKNIYEFFNLLAFLKHKNNKEKERIEKWKQTH